MTEVLFFTQILEFTPMMTGNKGLCTKQLHTTCTLRVFLLLYHLQSFYHLSYTVHSARLVELLDFPVEMVWNWLYFCKVNHGYLLLALVLQTNH